MAQIPRPDTVPKNGNHQFDQVWAAEGDGIVVVEAKSSQSTPLGDRLVEGDDDHPKRVPQGTREYLEDALEKMRERGRGDSGNSFKETRLANLIEDALNEENLHHVEEQGNPVTHTLRRWDCNTPERRLFVPRVRYFRRIIALAFQIKRHDLSTPAYRANMKSFSGDRARQIGRIERKTTSVSSALPSVYLDARISLAVDPEAGMLETWEAWAAAMQVADALFVTSTAPQGTEVECMIDHETRKLKSIGPRYFTNASNWTTAFFLAVTCRESERVRRLCEIPVDLLREAGESKGAEYNEYTYHWIAALQAFVLDRPGLVRHLTKAIELSDPDSGAFGGDTLDKLVFPQMNTFRCLLEEDSDEFNKALAQGLQLFKDYYTANEERAKDIKGVVPLGLLAMACWARDKQQHRPEFRLEVESGYLPRYILDGGWVGEFPV